MDKPKRLIMWICVFFTVSLFSSIIIFPHNSAHSLMRKYLSLLITWPGMLLIVGLVLLLQHHDDVSYLIRNIKFKFSSGTQVGAAQDQFISEENMRIKIQGAAAEFMGNITPKIEETALKAVFPYVWFERSIRKTFKSQFHLLQAAKLKNTLSLNDCIYFYNELLGHGGDAKTLSLDGFLGWLINSNKFLESKNNSFSLTPFGEKFLQYIEKVNYSENEFLPL